VLFIKLSIKLNIVFSIIHAISYIITNIVKKRLLYATIHIVIIKLKHYEISMTVMDETL
jgi:hypothetical protein